MKKSTITILAVILGASLFCLLWLQFSYISQIRGLRQSHFDECVNRSLSEVANRIESDEDRELKQQAVVDSLAELPDTILHEIDSLEQVAAEAKFYTRHSEGNRTRITSDQPLEKRVDFVKLDKMLKAELLKNGIDEAYHYTVLTANGRQVYQCPDFDAKGLEYSYKVTLFPDDPVTQMGTLNIHFPVLEDIYSRSFLFILPSLLFTLAIFVTFVITLILAFRQRKLAEIKNDFINNMTHEFKTPISSISLAAQMLADDSVTKSPQMTNRLSTTIMDETKRLRFQVDKVLQLSLYENQKVNYNLDDVDVNDLVENVVNTFALKVERNGGEIVSETRSDHPFVYVDEMHLTNVIFNLMDNAVKYCKEGRPLRLKVSTWNEGGSVCISVADNGIGMRKDDVKKIFEKFYRVHTGNRHDVKGFGLGLAYVKKIINNFHGTITADSELDKGTTFIIRLPEVSYE